MPYEEHPYVSKPSDDNIPVWRYMDLARFVSMLQTRKLFFARSDKMRDPFEGAMPRYTVETRLERYSKTNEQDPEMVRQMIEQMPQVFEIMRRYTLLNCWHMNEDESAAMWDLYAQRGAGIAVRSTFAHLCTSFDDAEGISIFIGTVNYVDYQSYVMPENNSLHPYFHKRKSFAHEQELRAVITNFNGMDVPPLESGMSIPCSLETLIDSVYVAPTAHGWFIDVVQKLLWDLGLHHEVHRSALDEKALY